MAVYYEFVKQMDYMPSASWLRQSQRRAYDNNTKSYLEHGATADQRRQGRVHGQHGNHRGQRE